MTIFPDTQRRTQLAAVRLAAIVIAWCALALSPNALAAGSHRATVSAGTVIARGSAHRVNSGYARRSGPSAARQRGILTINANVKGRVDMVSFLVDGIARKITNVLPYRLEWDTREVPNGLHTIEVRGMTNRGAVVSSTRARIFIANPPAPPPAPPPAAPLSTSAPAPAVSDADTTAPG